MAWSEDGLHCDVCVSFETAQQGLVLATLLGLGFVQHPGWNAPEEDTYRPGQSTTWGTMPAANMDIAMTLEGIVDVWLDPT